MSANITDYFNKASNMNGDYPPVATVSSARAAGATTLSCDDLTGWATSTPVHFSTFSVNADGTVDTSTQTDWKGIVSGNTITNLTRLAGAADSGNVSGDRVELNPTIGWLDDLITGLLVSHNQDGTLKDALIQARNIDWGTIEDFTDSLTLDNATIKTGAYGLKAVRFGKIVTLWGGFNVKSAAAYTSLITIPSGYRPSSGTEIKVRSSDLILDIRKDGKIRCLTAISSSTDFYVNVTYVAVN